MNTFGIMKSILIRYSESFGKFNFFTFGLLDNQKPFNAASIYFWIFEQAF